MQNKSRDSELNYFYIFIVEKMKLTKNLVQYFAGIIKIK